MDIHGSKRGREHEERAHESFSRTYKKRRRSNRRGRRSERGAAASATAAAHASRCSASSAVAASAEAAAVAAHAQAQTKSRFRGVRWDPERTMWRSAVDDPGGVHVLGSCYTYEVGSFDIGTALAVVACV